MIDGNRLVTQGTPANIRRPGHPSRAPITSSTPSLGADLSPHNSNTKLDVGFYSPEARTSINRRVSCLVGISEFHPRTTTNALRSRSYNRLGSPLADLSRSHPLTVGAPGRGDQELAVQHGGPTQRHLQRRRERPLIYSRGQRRAKKFSGGRCKSVTGGLRSSCTRNQGGSIFVDSCQNQGRRRHLESATSVCP
jgi:hypothetical protein